MWSGAGRAAVSGGGPSAGGAAAFAVADSPAAGAGTGLWPAPSAAAAPAAAPATVVASTLGVEALDIGTFVLRLTRTAVPAGTLTIFFRNGDSSPHNLWLAPPQGAGGQAIQISDDVGERGAATKTLTVTPGGWRLFCSIAGHGSMTRDLAVG